MANVENRAAEHGGEIITDTALHTWGSGKQPVAVRILEATTITAITSNTMLGMAYYDAADVTVDTPVILGNVTSLQLTSGAVQVIFS